MYVNGDELNMAIKDDPYYIELGNRIRKIREGKSLSREQLAEMTGLSSRHISSIELAEKAARPKTLEVIIKALGVSADRIFYPELEEDNKTLNEITRLSATCEPNQQKLILDIIRSIIKNKIS